MHVEGFHQFYSTKPQFIDAVAINFNEFNQIFHYKIILLATNVTTLVFINKFFIYFSNLSDDRANTSSKTVPTHSAI
jgi:hypothetical protein